MSKSILEMKSKSGSDDMQTPDWPVEALIKKIKQTKGSGYFVDKMVWEPACGNRNIVRYLNEQEIDCNGTDIKEGTDFLTFPPLIINHKINKIDMIITNPPYTLKDDFLKKCYECNKPFALLLPITALEGIERQKMYKQHGMQVLVLPRRVDFEFPDKKYKGKPWFFCSWFTNGFGFDKDLTFL